MDFKMLNDLAVFQQNGDSITMQAAPKTNLFNSMTSDYISSRFPFYCIRQKGDFAIRCKITPEFQKMYDQGCIIAYDNENKWVKFAYENSDAGYPVMVSVVTDGVSDDCSGEKIEEAGAWMQMTRRGNVFAFHYSLDKQIWNFVRICRLAMNEEIQLGISAQSPIGQGCTVRFEGLELIERDYPDLRHLK